MQDVGLWANRAGNIGRNTGPSHSPEEDQVSYENNLVDGLVDELLAVIHKYDDALMVSTVIGCLELIKQQLIEESREEDDD